MKVDIKSYTLDTFIDQELNKADREGSTILLMVIAAVAWFNSFLTFMDGLIIWIFIGVATFMMLELNVTRMISVIRALKAGNKGVTAQDIHKWMEASGLTHNYTNKTLTVYTPVPDVPVLTLKSILRLMYWGCASLLMTSHLSKEESNFDESTLTIQIRATSNGGASALFGHNLGLLIQHLQKGTSSDVIEQDSTPTFFQHIKGCAPQYEEPAVVQAVYAAWEADLYAMYFGIKNLGMPSVIMVSTLLDYRRSYKSYDPQYHLSMMYANTLAAVSFSFEQEDAQLTWPEFLEKAYQALPSTELFDWVRTMRRSEFEGGMWYAYKKGEKLFEQVQGH